MAKPVIGLSPRIKKNDGLYSVKDKYLNYVEKIGGGPVVFQPVLSNVKEYVSKVDGILLFGNKKDVHPSFYNEDVIVKQKFMEDSNVKFEIEIIKEAKNQKKPILAICYGSQVLNVAFNGTLHQSLPSNAEKTIVHQESLDTLHDITIEENSLLSKIIKEERCVVNSNHHQAVKDLGEGLRACAFSDDGLCEAIEHAEAEFIMGVQWHPERLKKESSSRLFEAFIRACKGKI